MSNEADTCRKWVTPRLQAAGWDNDPHSIAEQRSITDGRVIPVGKGFIRKSPKRVDYLLRYMRDHPLSWQQTIREVRTKLNVTSVVQSEVTTELGTLMPAILDKAFKAEL